MAAAMMSGLAAQAAIEYTLLTGRGVMQFLARVGSEIVAFIGTPRGILIGGAGVVLLAFLVGRKRRW
jgi:hypothetical protein